MYLWRNLPKGQLSAVLRWVCDTRPAAAPAARPEAQTPLPADSGRGQEPLPR